MAFSVIFAAIIVAGPLLLQGCGETTNPQPSKFGVYVLNPNKLTFQFYVGEPYSGKWVYPGEGWATKAVVNVSSELSTSHGEVSLVPNIDGRRTQASGTINFAPHPDYFGTNCILFFRVSSVIVDNQVVNTVDCSSLNRSSSHVTYDSACSGIETNKVESGDIKCEFTISANPELAVV